MAQITGVNVTFHTTRDDKDDQDIVSISIVARGSDSAVGAPVSVGGGNKWDNDTTVGPFFVAIAPQESSTLDLHIDKTGTDGWIYHVSVAGVVIGGGQVTLIANSQEIHFEDAVESISLPLG
ncbi:MAG TPA: hypothetical protein VMJ32_16635 [Pirellulales bacterium]|nr:hypothetical protein [Pirellulales bacterium]